MPGFDRDQLAIDNTVENRRLGSVLLTVGWILLWLAIEGVLGLALVIMGTRYRRAIGPTRLGQRDLDRTLAQQRQDDAEDHRVA
jgi:hypothetical protein